MCDRLPSLPPFAFFNFHNGSDKERYKDKTPFATGTWTSHCFKRTSSYISEFSSRLLHCMSYVSFRLFWITLLPNTNKNHGKFHTQSTWLDCLPLTQVSKQTVIPYYIIPNRNSIFHKSHLKGRRTEKAFKDFYGLVLFCCCFGFCFNLTQPHF